MTLRQTLAAFQAALQDAGEEASTKATIVRDFQGGVAHGYFKAAEEISRWVAQGKFGSRDALDQDIEERS